ncbi:hypothetical protein D3C81_1227960 [compost metagenome]
MFTRVGLEQRVADEVVTAKRQHRAASGQNVLGVSFDALRNAVWRAEIEIAVAIIDDRQMIERVKRPRPVAFPGNPGGSGANPAWSEAGAGTVAGGGVERHAADRDIDAAQVTAVAPTHETGNAGVRTFGGGAVEAVAGHGLIVLHRHIHRGAPVVIGGYGKWSTDAYADACL